MSREIKFRAFRKLDEFSEMIYNIFFEKYGEGWNGGNPDYKHYRISYAVGNFFLANYKEVEIMQYIDLKDKHGKDIYESDIVTGCMFNGSFAYGVIEWYKCGWIVKPIGKFMEGIDLPTNPAIEVIGNIYQNPELLKK